MDKKILIGRDPGCDIVVESDYTSVSDQHATMHINANGEIIFEDISSSGSSVSGSPVNNGVVKVAFGAPIVLGGSYYLSWQKIQPLLYRESQSSPKNPSSVGDSNASSYGDTCNQNLDQYGQPTQRMQPGQGYGSGSTGQPYQGYQTYPGNQPYPESQTCPLNQPYPLNQPCPVGPNQQNPWASGGNTIPGGSNMIDIYRVDDAYLSSWSWGAFFLMPIWGFGNGCWWAFFLTPFCPLANIIIAIFANRLAWKNRKWDNFYQFKTAQETWAKGGLIGFLYFLVIAIFWFVTFSMFTSAFDSPTIFDPGSTW